MPVFNLPTASEDAHKGLDYGAFTHNSDNRQLITEKLALMKTKLSVHQALQALNVGNVILEVSIYREILRLKSGLQKSTFFAKILPIYSCVYVFLTSSAADRIMNCILSSFFP